MLRINPLQPPRPHSPAGPAANSSAAPEGPAFVAAEDFDRTGIMAGVDPSESCYWWMPELYGPDEAATARPTQAASGSETRASAAA